MKYKTLRFEGINDYEFAETNISKVNITIEEPFKKTVQCLICSGKEKAVIIGDFDRYNNGCWDIGICPASPEHSIPEWPIRFSSDGFTTILEIDVPEDFSLEFLINGVYKRSFSLFKEAQDDFYKSEKIRTILKKAVNAFIDSVYDDYDPGEITEEEVIDIVLKKFGITREEYRFITQN